MVKLVLLLCLVAFLAGTGSALFQRCYTCPPSSSHEQCNQRNRIKPCIGSCQTREEKKKGGGFEVEKSCVRLLGCRVGCENRYTRCYDCCWGDLCNKRGGWIIPKPPRWHPCDDDPCLNSGTCVKRGRKFSCRCQTGYSGKNCEKVGPVRINPVGCFEDKEKDRAFNLGPWTDDKMTVDSCLKYCRSKNYQYVGMQNGDECWCGRGNGFKKHGELNLDRCPMFCKGDKNQKNRCGSGWVNSVYRV